MHRTPPLNGLLDFAADLANQAGSLTLGYFQSARLRVDYKPDASPVTDADRAAEQLIREKIADAFPEHAIIGEEFGERPGHPGAASSDRPRFRWIIDPIDGTKSFIHGVPLYGVMIALEIDDTPALGVLRFPALEETVAAARGHGCHFNGARCHVRPTERLADATLLSSAVPTLGDNPSATGNACVFPPSDKNTCGLEPIDKNACVFPPADKNARVFAGMDRLMRSVKYFRTWGDCYGYALVATGRADIMLDPKLELWDCAPMLPILTEAGGRFTDLAGQATIHGHSGLATNGRLHDEVLAMIHSENSEES